MSDRWIQAVTSHMRKGQLHRDLHIPQGEKIPQKALQAALEGKYGEAVARRARLAKTLKKM